MTQDERAALDGPRQKTALDLEYEKALAVIADQRKRIEELEAALSAPPPRDERAALVEQACRRFLAGYAREVNARTAWATQSDPRTEESRWMFNAVLAREAETRELAMELGRLVYPGESAALSAPPPQDARTEALSEWANAAFEARENHTRDPHEHIERLITAGDAAIAALSAPPPADPRQAQIAVLEAVEAEIEAIDAAQPADAVRVLEEVRDEILGTMRLVAGSPHDVTGELAAFDACRATIDVKLASLRALGVADTKGGE